MRRKRNRSRITKRGLDPSALRPAPQDDPTDNYEQRRGAYSAWMSERDTWIARREAYAEQYGWPDGELARFEEEDTHHPVPDEPFDPDHEIAAGRL